MKGIPEVMGAMAALAAALGVTNINKLDGCWEHQIDDQWWMACNGHREPTECSTLGIAVPPFCMYVEYNGWPAGVVSPAGGSMAAGSCANEDKLIVAIEVATAKAKASKGDQS